MLVPLASVSYATDWVFDSSKLSSDSFTWTEALGVAASEGVTASDGYWYKKGTEANKEYIQGAFSDTDTFSYTGASNVSMYIDVKSVNLKSLTFDGKFFLKEGIAKNWADPAIITASDSINLTGNFASSTNYFRFVVDSVVIGSQATQKTDNNNASITIDVAGKASSFNEGLANPDAVVNYIAKAGNQFALISKDTDVFVKVYGLGAWGGVKFGSEGLGTAYLVLANTKSSTMTPTYSLGGMYGYGGAGHYVESKTGVRKLAIVMNAEADGVTQQLTSQSHLFRGGVVVVNGTLDANFNQDVTKYKLTDGGKSVTAWTKDKLTQTQFSHGDLTMKGGVFMSSLANASDASLSYGYRFTNIRYEDGEIKLVRKVGESYIVDYIDLTSYYFKTGEEFDATAEVGGKVFVASGKQVKFDFGDYKWFLLEGDDAYSFGDNGAKLIAWDSSEGMKASDFWAEDIEEAGDVYTAKFTLADDGLYVKYVAVPEPSTYAVMLGALALGFALYRRKK